MLNKTRVTTYETHIHITCNHKTLVVPLTAGFSFDEGELAYKEERIPCTTREYKSILKQYHKALKPRRSAHAIWAASTVIIVCWVSLIFLTIGLNANGVGPAAAASIPQTTETPSIQPIAPQQATEELSTAPLNSSPTFPFGNG